MPEDVRPPWRDRRPLVVACVGMLLALAVYAGLYQQERLSALRAMQSAASETFGRSIAEAENHFHAIQRMGRRWEARDGIPWDEWVADSTLLVQDIPALKGLVWSNPGLTENWAVDAGGTLKIGGVDDGELSAGPGAWSGTLTAMPRSSGPMPLVHGSPGFHYEVSLSRVDGEPAGTLRAIFRYRDLLAPAFWEFAETYGLRVTVNGKPVYDDRLHAGAVDVAISRRVLGEMWQVSLSPIGPLVPARQLAVAIAASVLIALLGLLTATAFHFRGRAAWRALQEADARYRMKTAIEALDTPFAFFDSDDRLVYWNEAFRELHDAIADTTRAGVTYGELVRAAIGAGHIREATGREEAFYESRMELHRGPGFVLERELKDGRWRQTTERRLPDGSTVTLITDISEQKQRETELRAQRDRLSVMREQLKAEQERFQHFAEASADWFWTTDAEHRYTWFSENVENWIDFPREWHYGKSRIELGQPAEPDAEWDRHMEQLQNHEPFRDVIFYRNAPDGERWIRSSGVPQFDANGAFTGYLGTGSDISELKLAERRYNTVRDQLGSAIDSISEGIAIFDKDDRLTLCNANFREQNPSAADILQPGQDFAGLIRFFADNGLPDDTPAEERDAWFAQRMKIRDDQARPMEFQVSNGGWCRVTDYRTPEGGTVIVRTDITGLKQRQLELKAQRDSLSDMREQLKAEQARFQAFAEASADWFWITDENHDYTWLSDNISEHLPLTPADLIGRPRVGTSQTTRDFPDREAHMAQLQRHEPFRDVLIRWSDDQDERWIRSAGIPQFDSNGTFTGYLGTGKDITELKLAESRYEAIRDQLSNALGSISEGLMLFDSNDRLVLCNENFRENNQGMENIMQPGSGYTEIIEQASRTILPPDTTAAERLAWLDQRMNLRDSDDPVMEFENYAGQWCRIAEHRTWDGGTIMVRTDITDLKQRQIELEIERNNAHEANRAKTDFLTNMSHELRTPLNAIIGFADIMSTGLYGPLEHRYASYADDIGDSGRHLLSLINDLLDGARIESGKYTLDLEELSLDLQLRQIEALMQPILEDRDLTIGHVGVVGENVRISADQRAFKQILLNLLSNAAKFSHQGGRIEISSRISGTDLELQISDNGIGLSGNDLERVFERFVQVQDPMRRSHDGTGIGLPLSRSLAELHGGSLHLEQGDKGGVTAVLRLPGAVITSASEAAPMRSIA